METVLPTFILRCSANRITMKLLYVLIIFAGFISISLGSDNKIVKVRLESCPGCSLNRLKEVKQFVYEDIPKYGIEWKKIGGAPPELIFYDDADQEVERHLLGNLSRKECNDLLQSKGFHPDKQDQTQEL